MWGGDADLCDRERKKAIPLLYLLFKIPEQVRMKEILYCDSESITELFDRRNGCAVVTSADDIIDGRLRNAAEIAEFVNGDALRITQFNDSHSNRFSDAQQVSPSVTIYLPRKCGSQLRAETSRCLSC